MKTKSLLIQIRPRSFACWRALPIFGPLLEDFMQWMANQGYAPGTMGNYLKILPKVVRWLPVNDNYPSLSATIKNH
jgi:hypothetical protein